MKELIQSFVVICGLFAFAFGVVILARWIAPPPSDCIRLAIGIPVAGDCR
jgi:hypothetical protein